MHTIDEDHFRESVVGLPGRMGRRRDFMTPAHVGVREYAVRELRPGAPIPPTRIAADLGMALPTVERLLEDLERNLFFLVRGPAGDVVWAFPVTAEATRYEMAFPAGERLYAA